ncbi:AAA family ATPase [Streptomyces sp. NPDC102381]|uniref:AAA family ATPase n=1 Tax=Streptomyces sp. NPDC102381 TaxID=3366164 RepID=UPI003819A9B0
MTSLHLLSPQEQTDCATRVILSDLHTLTHRGLVVDAPPGAGKSTLVVQAAGTLAQAGAPCIVMAQTNSQVDHLVRRLTDEHPGLKIGRFASAEHVLAADLQEHPGIRTGTRVQDLEKSSHVIVGTAMKWATVTGRSWPWAVIDETYQMRSDVLLRTAHLFDQILFVGDPGQLNPFSTADFPYSKGLPHDPLNSAATVLLDNNPDLPVHSLPVSWRLPPAAVPLISDAFYPSTPFRAGTGEADRTLGFSATGMGTPVDEVVETAARTGWALLELPARVTHRVDVEALHAVLAVAERLLIRGAVTTCEKAPDGHVLEPRDIAIGTAHRIQTHQIRALLAREYPELRGVTIDTANRLQGDEFRITIVLHPLSGRGDASAFHLEAGRLCVLTSRHRHACIVVARAGIPELLDAHPANDPVHLGVTSKAPEGWEAHQAVLAHLARHTVHAPAPAGPRRG